MRRMLTVVMGLLLLCVAFPAAGHELIVKPTRNEAKKGEVLPIELQSTHVFIVKEEVEEIPYIKGGIVKGGQLIESELTPNGPELRIDFSVKLDDDASSSLVVANKVGMVWSITNEGGKVGPRKELEKQGLKVLSSTRIDKYAKAIVNASPEDKNFGTAVGQDLEIVPITNPATAKSGEYIQVKILHLGQPVSTPVWATCDGFSQHPGTYAYYTESDAQGIAHIKVTQPGLWLVRAVKEKDAGVEGEYDTRTLRSTFVFPVK